MLFSAALAIALARGLEFERLEVEWVATNGHVKDLDMVLPHHQAELVRLLGDTNYTVRRLAEEELVRMGPAASVALAWGMRAKDPTIASSSRRLRDRLYTCANCLGSGACPDAHDQGRCPDRCNYASDCRACSGTGDPRFEIVFVRDEGYVCRQRDLFAGEKP